MKYQQLQIEKQLLTSPIAIDDLNILQRNSITKLKEKMENKVLYYHSTNQQDQILRVVVFAFLSKLFTQFNLQNMFNINKFKQIVYSSPLSSQITTSRGIERNQLLKLFAKLINSIVISTRAQSQICSLMNTSQFFEEVLLKVLIQDITKKKKCYQYEININLLQQYFKQQFNLKITVLGMEDLSLEEESNEIILFLINKHIHKKSLNIVDQQSHSSSSIKQKSININNELSPNIFLQSIKLNHTISVDDMSPKFTSNGKSTPNRKKPLSSSSSQNRNRRSNRSQNKGIFSMFCCCD